MKTSNWLLFMVLGVLFINECRACFGTDGVFTSGLEEDTADSGDTGDDDDFEDDDRCDRCDDNQNDEEVGPNCASRRIKDVLDKFVDVGGGMEDKSKAIQAEVAQKLGGRAEAVCNPTDSLGWSIWARRRLACKVVGEQATCLAWLD